MQPQPKKPSKIRRECFKKFAESINLCTDPNHVWNKCKIFKNKWARITLQHWSENLQADSKIEDALNKINPSWAQTNPNWLPSHQQNEFFDSHFTSAEFNIALDHKNIKSAPGMDGIDYEILKNLPIKFKLLLLDIYNDMYEKRVYPRTWKQSFIHFIKKADGKSLRPISLTSCLCKLCETLIQNRLQWWSEYHNLISINQQGFRRGKSCVDNVINLALKVDEAFTEKKKS